MARLVFEERYRIRFVPTLTNKAAPTVAQITAGTDITTLVAKDGVNYGTSENKVSTSDIASAFDSETIGSWGASLQLTFFKDDATDTAWDLFVRGLAGFIVIAPFGFKGANNAPLAADKVYVFPVVTQQPQLAASAANEHQTFMTSFAVTSPPDYRAVVAA
jgi:hypothetical protein